MINIFDKNIPEEILEDIDKLAAKCDKNKKQCFGFSYPIQPVYNIFNSQASRTFDADFWISKNFDILKDYLTNVKGYKVDTNLLDDNTVFVTVYPQ